MLNFNSRPKQSLLRPFLAMISASSLALIGVIAVPAATETASAETVFSEKGFSIDGEAAFDFSGYSVHCILVERSLSSTTYEKMYS